MRSSLEIFYNMASILGFVVKSIFYMMLLLGIYIAFSDFILSFIKKSSFKERYRKIKIGRKTGIYRHVELLFNIVIGKKSSGHVYFFFVITSTIFIVFAIILSRQSSLLFALITSIMFASFPYVILRLRLRNLRVEGSFEGEILVSEILNQYKINYYNMLEAIDHSISFLDSAPISQRLLFKLSMRLKTYQSDDELKEILTEFTYAIDTEWIKLLSNNMYLSIEGGMNVTAGIEDILKECRQIKSMIERSKRINSEGFSIITLFIPILYIGTVWMAMKYFNFTIQKFFQYQFCSEIGFRFFTIILILMFFNFVAMTIIKKHKFDY